MIVGAWAAYLVPMWLRRQDELNEARPTERFSTAIRLLTGRGGADRTQDRDGSGEDAGGDDESPDAAPAADGVVDVRAAAMPVTDSRPAAPRPRRPRKQTPAAPAARPGAAAKARVDEEPDVPRAGRTDAHAGTSPSPRAADDNPAPAPASAPAEPTEPEPAAGPAPAPAPARNQTPQATAERRARARVLARRRRTLTLLFVALTVGAVAASAGGPRFLWAVVIPVLLLTAYVVRVRTQERRRRTFTADPARGEAAARRLREGRAANAAGADRAGRQSTSEGKAREARRRTGTESPAPRDEAGADAEADYDDAHAARDEHDGDAHDPSATAPFDAPAAAYEADRRALVEQTDHAEWVDQQRERDRPADAGWDPVPVPLPTYVTAPVAPRATRGLDLDAPDTWSSARSSTAEPHQPSPEAPPADPGTTEDPPDPDTPRRRPRTTNHTPLFDQYADPPRRRAANE